MKKIMLIANHDEYVYKLRKEVIEKILLSGYEVYLVCPHGPRIDYFVGLGCKAIDISFERHGKNPFKDVSVIKKYYSVLKRIKPDVVLTYTIKPNLYGAFACKLLNIPCIANITGLGQALEQDSLLQKFLIIMYKVAFSKINTIFFQNEDNLEFFNDNKISKANNVLIPGSGVNIKDFSYIMYPDEDKNIEFVFISRIMREKGFFEYIKAAEIIKKEYPEVIFNVCGFCEEEFEDVLNDFQNRDVIKYYGMLPDVREILARTHCTVHPTYYPEGLSNVLLESAASGRPIITTGRSGCKEVLNGNLNGFIVKEKNVDDLVRVLSEFLIKTHEEKKEMGREGRRFVKEKFNRDIVVNAYLKEIEKYVQGDSE